MPPTLVLIRHAQALHNIPPHKSRSSRSHHYTIHDPPLSELGQQQCLSLRANLIQTLASYPVDLILVSPMRRTIQTALLSLDFLLAKDIPLVAHASWQETTEKPCDIGSPLDDLAREFPQVDFSRVDPVFPDKTSAAGARYRWSKPAILARGQDALDELYGRKERCIVVVSHSGFLRQGVTGCWYHNSDYRIFDFEERRGGERARIRQREETERGGLGLSWTETVELGTGLPEESAREALGS